MAARRKPKPKLTSPLEHYEQKAVAWWLDMRGHLYCAVPNGGKRSKITAAILKSEGVKPSVPDILVFERANLAPFGCALEMKRVGGAGPTPGQRKWLADLAALGWVPLVGYGAEDAIRKLQALGY